MMESNGESVELAVTTSSSNSNLSDSNGSNNSNDDNNEAIKEHLQLINYSSFEDMNVLDNGLLKAYWKDTNTHVALKKVKSLDIEKLKLLHKLSNHQNIVKIFGFSKEADGGDDILVMEYANGGNLRQYLKDNHQNLTWNNKMRMTIDITNGLQCIHSHDIVHTSLHPNNVLVHNDRLLISDLGLSRSSNVSTSKSMEILPYVEPDFVANPSYPRDKKSDIYSLGFLMYEISSGRVPFASFHYNLELSKKILSGIRDDPIIGTPIEYIDLYEQCWDNDPTMRPSVDDVLARLARMNLTPVYEDDLMITNHLKGVEKKNANVKKVPLINDEIHSIQIDSQSSGMDHLDSVIIDFGGGVDSGYGESRERQERKEEKGCLCLPCIPCLPKCRVTFGVFLCWMCIILLIACFMLGVFLGKLVGKKK